MFDVGRQGRVFALKLELLAHQRVPSKVPGSRRFRGLAQRHRPVRGRSVATGYPQLGGRKPYDMRGGLSSAVTA